MNFLTFCQFFENLEKSKKRLNKILILKEFYLNNKVETPLIFDMISGNYSRQLGKTNISISLKTIFSVLSFLSNKTTNDLNKMFSKSGDLGFVAVEVLKNKSQKSLNEKKLTFEFVLSSIEKISKTNGLNSNKRKIEILTQLFLNIKQEVEIKFLTRFLIGDLRIGVSDGTLIESCLNIFIPNIKEIHTICENCNKINLSNLTCYNCEEKIDKKKQKELIKNNFEILKKEAEEEEEKEEEE